MSKRTIAFSSPNSASASARASSVLLTPVGPRKRNEPTGRLGSASLRGRGAPRATGPHGPPGRPPARATGSRGPAAARAPPVELRDGDAGPPRDDLGDVLGRHLRRTGAAVGAAFVEAAAHLRCAGLHLVRALVVLPGDRLVLLALERRQLALQRAAIRCLVLVRSRLLRGGLVDQVDRLVGQEPVADVPVRELGSCDDRLGRDADAVKGLVPVAQPRQDLDRLVD